MDRPSARLYLDAIGAHVVARVTERSPTHLTVSRELSFLKLDSVVHDETGRRARVSGVSVVLEKGTPRLVLELAYEEASAQLELPDLPATSAASTLPIISARAELEESAPIVVRESTPPGALPASSAKLSRGEDTLLFVTQRNTPTPPEGTPAHAPAPAQLAAPAPGPWSLLVRWLGQLAASFARVLRGGAV
jgi:hypothetical protein